MAIEYKTIKLLSDKLNAEAISNVTNSNWGVASNAEGLGNKPGIFLLLMKDTQIIASSTAFPASRFSVDEGTTTLKIASVPFTETYTLSDGAPNKFEIVWGTSSDTSLPITQANDQAASVNKYIIDQNKPIEVLFTGEITNSTDMTTGTSQFALTNISVIFN